MPIPNKIRSEGAAPIDAKKATAADILKWDVQSGRIADPQFSSTPDIADSTGQYGFGATTIPQQAGTSVDKINSWGKGMPGGQKISDDRQRIMDSIKRRSLETVPDYIYNTNMPERPPMAERQVEGRSASGAGLSGSVSPESQVQDALRRLMMRRS